MYVGISGNDDKIISNPRLISDKKDLYVFSLLVLKYVLYLFYFCVNIMLSLALILLYYF